MGTFLELLVVWPVLANSGQMIASLLMGNLAVISCNLLYSLYRAWVSLLMNKWLCFGLALHTGIEPFSGHILWTKVWHSNRNPQLILSYYLESVEFFGCKCLANTKLLILFANADWHH